VATVKYNISIQQGSKYELSIQARNNDNTVMDLTGYSGRMQVRPTKASSTVLLDANTTNGRITINAPGGIVSVSVGADVTALLNWTVAYYDLEVYTVDPTNVKRLVEGYASLSREVTR
jgi:hypothetical protein